MLFKTTLMVKMKLFLIFNNGAETRSFEQPTSQKTKKDYDKKYDLSKRTRTFQETWLTDFQWLPVDDNQIATSSGASV